MSILATTQRRGLPGYPARATFAAMAGACLIAGFVADLAFLGTADPSWTFQAAWLVLGGSVLSGFAAMAAFIAAARQNGERRGLRWTGLVGYCAVWGLSLASAIFHSHGVAGFPAAPVLSALVAALVMAMGRAHWQAVRAAGSKN
ncbi:MAG: hypothetical protein EOP94_01815 [Zymomonas sp.]|nr:MAG: hypothetical protein EOP94_01815 [Zymomonas sp.]